jgi:hypothetical protein
VIEAVEAEAREIALRLGLLPWDSERLTITELRTMYEAREERDQDLLRAIGSAGWWAVAPHLSKKSRKDVTIEKVRESCGYRGDV